MYVHSNERCLTVIYSVINIIINIYINAMK